MSYYFFTQEGFRKIKAEVDALERYIKVDIAKALATAAAHGDLRENAEYAAAKENQSVSMAKLSQLRERIMKAQVVRRDDFPDDIVSLCKSVTLKEIETGNEIEYTILGEGESDVERNIISYQSPLAEALIGHKKGEIVDVQLPRGTEQYEILGMKFFEDA
jgi:transcription elongation factor GreA